MTTLWGKNGHSNCSYLTSLEKRHKWTKYFSQSHVTILSSCVELEFRSPHTGTIGFLTSALIGWRLEFFWPLRLGFLPVLMSPPRNGWGKRVLQKAFSVNVAELPTFVYLGVSWPFDKLHIFLWNDYQHWDCNCCYDYDIIFTIRWC